MNNEVQLENETDDRILVRLMNLCFTRGGMVSSQFGIDENYSKHLKNKFMQAVSEDIIKFRNYDKTMIVKIEQDRIAKELEMMEKIRSREEKWNIINGDFKPIEKRIKRMVAGVEYAYAKSPGELLHTPGVYLIFSPDLRLLYIGQSTDMHRRLCGRHHVYKKDNHLVLQLHPIDDAEKRLTVEREAIRIFYPAMNKRDRY
jgi:hypothetical protein